MSLEGLEGLEDAIAFASSVAIGFNWFQDVKKVLKRFK